MARIDPKFPAQMAPVHGRGSGRARQGKDEAEAGALGLAAGDAAAGRPWAGSVKAGPQHQPSGINAATRELGIDRTEAQRAVKIDGLTDEAKQAIRLEIVASTSLPLQIIV